MTPQSDEAMTDLRPRVVSAEHQLSDHHHRLQELEKWRHHSDVADARMSEKFTAMGTKLDKIDSNLSRILWICISGILGGVILFLMNGGFKVPG